MMKLADKSAGRNLFLLLLVLFGVAARAHAQGGCITGGGGCVPEIDPSLSSGGIALLGGAVLLVRGRHRP